MGLFLCLDTGVLSLLKNFLIYCCSFYVRSNKGATAIEYCLMASAVAIAIIVIVFAVGDNVETLFTDVDTEMTANF